MFYFSPLLNWGSINLGELKIKKCLVFKGIQVVLYLPAHDSNKAHFGDTLDSIAPMDAQSAECNQPLITWLKVRYDFSCSPCLSLPTSFALPTCPGQ